MNTINEKQSKSHNQIDCEHERNVFDEFDDELDL